VILAAADAGRYDGKPPPLLRQAWQLKRWHALPEAGGLRDQPAGLLQRMGHVADVYEAHRAYRTALYSYPDTGLGQWEARNPDVMTILQRVRRLKREIESNG